MKKSIFFLLFVLLASGCSKEEIAPDGNLKAAKAGKYDICHFDADNSIWKVINVNANAVDALLNLGDVLLVDNDGDGWVEAINECVPGGDCDDNDPAINPGMEEICGNDIDENCDGTIVLNCCPYYTVEEIVALAPISYFDWRLMDCLPTESVGFMGHDFAFGIEYSPNYMVVDFNFVYIVDVDPDILVACEEVLVEAQKILNAPPLCAPTGMEMTSKSLKVSPF